MDNNAGQQNADRSLPEKTLMPQAATTIWIMKNITVRIGAGSTSSEKITGPQD